MNSSKKIGLIGRVDPNCALFDGQTVKTRAMHRLLCEIYGDDRVVLVDTTDYQKNAIKVAGQFISCMLSCDDVVVLLSENGRRAFFPILSFFARKRGLRVYHNLIGGWLASNLEKYPQWIGYLNDFRVNWVESYQLAGALADKGVDNAVYLPNFKYYDNLCENDARSNGAQMSFCTFSRVMAQKGIGDAMEAVENLNSRGVACTLDIYGPIDGSYDREFKKLLECCAHARYRGCVAPEEGAAEISRYDALLFPTKWSLEGIPGTIIDALTAGVPVIASRWQYYDEMLEDGVTGFGYDISCPALLEETIEKYINKSAEVGYMRERCRERATSYRPEVVASEIRRKIGN